MKRVLYGLLIATVTLSCLGFSGLYYLGMDDDGQNKIDSLLETEQEDEEIGFNSVAQLIGDFVKNQYNRRKLDKHLKKFEDQKAKDTVHTRIYDDLPGDGAYATRDVHRKTHGCFRASLNVVQTLQNRLNNVLKSTISNSKQIDHVSELGIFQPGAQYDAIVRYSNGHPKNRKDSAPDARGFAVKILGKGTLKTDQALQSHDAQKLNSKTELDILSINFPTFFVNEKNTALKYYEINNSFLPGALDFVSSGKGMLHELLALTTQEVEPLEAKLALAVNGSIIKSAMFQEYFSMVPSRLGTDGSGRAVKYFWSPVMCLGQSAEDFERAKAEQWPEWSNNRHYANPLKAAQKVYRQNSDPNYLRANINENLSKGDFCYGLFFQPYIDPVSTNIEDSTDIWLRNEEERKWWIKDIAGSWTFPISATKSFDNTEYAKTIKIKKISTPVRAATLRIHKLNSSSEAAMNTKTCEELSFNPWNGNIVHHKPLGVISRLKRRVYNASRRARHFLNFGVKDEVAGKERLSD